MKQVHAIAISSKRSTLQRVRDTLKELEQETHTGTSIEELDSLLQARERQLEALVVVELPRLPISEVRAIVDRVFSQVESAVLLLRVDALVAQHTHLIKGKGVILYLHKPLNQQEFKRMLQLCYEPIIGEADSGC